jgi:mevalonate kinase
MILASAPGSLMLFGEHAVLKGQPAIVAAHQGRVSARLEEAASGCWATSDLWPGALDLTSAPLLPQGTFVKQAFDAMEAWKMGPFTLQISSDCPSHLGFGSSAAVVVATLGALWSARTSRVQLMDEERLTLWKLACEVIQKVQGVGSAADAAASLWGGVVWFDPQGFQIKQLVQTLTLGAVYCGFKEKTPHVTRHVQSLLGPFPHIQDALFKLSGQLTKEAAQALLEGHREKVGQLANMAQGLMEAYGVNLPVLQELCHRLREWPGIVGAKISGSGLGDCVIGIGNGKVCLEESWKTHMSPYTCFPITIAEEGLILAAA